jgi:adenine phosphoribosyltransferase
VALGERCVVELPLVADADGFAIYALDLMGRNRLNGLASELLVDGLRDSGALDSFDLVLTAESKAIALAQELTDRLGNKDYVVLRKSQKLYMRNPLAVEVQSITTRLPQTFWLGEDQVELLRGKRVCVVDDVISTGGTLTAIFNMAEKVGFEVTAIASVLTESDQRTAFRGVPVVSLGHIPLPGTTAYAPLEDN